jgi:hypothetical protein
MRTLLICAALVAAAPAFAQDLVARQGNDSVRLGDKPCSSQLVLGRIQPQQAEDYRQASAVVDGQTFQACWRSMGSAALLMYEDGDQGLIPLQELKPELTA